MTNLLTINVLILFLQISMRLFHLQYLLYIFLFNKSIFYMKQTSVYLVTFTKGRKAYHWSILDNLIESFSYERN